VVLLGALSVADRMGFFAALGPVRAANQDDYTRYHGRTFSVAKVVDGDTIDLNVGDDPGVRGGEFKTTRVRLLGVDTPEVATDKREAMYYGAEASAFTKEMVLGQRVRVELAGRNNTRGRYGRLLAYVFVAETGEMLNEALLRNGRAYADPRFAHPRKATFAALEARARQSNTGLWKAVRPEQYPYWKRKRKMAARVPSSAQSVTGRRPVSQRTR